MGLKKWSSWLFEKRFDLLALLLIGLGITFRAIMFFQNRNLIIDEANVVRNIYERGFLELLKPLSYEQYAPPIYLWSLELFSYFFGYSEQAMRLVALLCGVGSMFLFWALLRKILPKSSLWLPLGLLCFAPILVKYSNEVKQYVPDALVAISLVFFALKLDLFELSKKRFAITWIIIGSLAVWASQPSVFILASVGIYYAILVWQSKKWNYLTLLILLSITWLSQFGLYYEFILKSQINSDYLQNYHRPYFLFATPNSMEEWKHNWERLKEILHNTAGYWQWSFYSSIVFIAMGSIYLLRKSVPLFALLAGPVVLTLIAAALNQFSLIERVIIFILPFTMILLGYGFAWLLKIRIRFLQVCISVWGLTMLYNYNLKSLFSEKYNFQELTVAMDYVLSKHAVGKELYIDCASKDTYIYYTQVHPHQSKYASLFGAHLFDWSDDNFEMIAANMPTTKSYFIFTGGNEDLRIRHLAEVKKQLKPIDSFQFAYSYVYVFKKAQ